MGTIVFRELGRLASALDKTIPAADREQLQKVMEIFPVRLTQHLLKVIKMSPQVARQFLPAVEELEFAGSLRPFTGVTETGIAGVLRMYIDRCVIMPVQQCPAYCRFCFRKDYMTRSNPTMTASDINLALNYVQNDAYIKDILVTGGDPLLNLKKLKQLLDGLRKIKRIEVIRIATRSLSYEPSLLSAEVISFLRKYHSYMDGKPVEIGTHFNHPDEITEEAKEALARCIERGIRVYNQGVLLKGINDDSEIIEELYRRLRGLGVEAYFLTHCMPVKGGQYFRTLVQKGLDIKKDLRGLATGRINPTYIVPTKIGKVEIGVDGRVLKKSGKYLWIETPYRKDIYEKSFPGFTVPKDCYVNPSGYMVARYLDGTD